MEAGDTVTLTRGAESFSPLEYQSFDVGPFAVTVRLRDGESHDCAVARGTAVLDEIARREYEAAVTRFESRVEDLADRGRALVARRLAARRSR